MGYEKDRIDDRVNYHNGELPFHHPHRMKSDAAECIEDVEMWLTVGYSCALHLHHVLMVMEEHGLTRILETDVSVRHLFHEEVTNGTNAAKIAQERANRNGNTS